MTQRDAIKKALEAMGYTAPSDLQRSKKYITMVHPLRPVLVFLGKAGAARVGRTITASQPMYEAMRRDLIKEGRGE